jgi:nuclear pore complex protein Nup155
MGLVSVLSNQLRSVTHLCVVAGSGSGSAIFSGRREGFALYFARLVRPLWKSPLTKPACAQYVKVVLPTLTLSAISSAGLQQSNVSDVILVTVQKNLYALKDFLDNNPHLFHSSPGEPGGAHSAPGNDQEAWKVRVLIGKCNDSGTDSKV